MNILAAIKREGEKTRTAARQVESPIGWDSSGCKSIGRLCGARSRRREEARPVRCWQSGDCEGGEEEGAKARN